MTNHLPFSSRDFQQRAVATLVLLAALGCAVPSASASRISSTKYSGIIQSIDSKTKTIVFQRGPDGKDFQLNWYWDTTFVADGKRVHADALKPRTTVKVEYHSPLFGRQYISRIEWDTKTSSEGVPVKEGR